METSARAHKQTTAQATIQEVLHQPMFRARVVTCSRTHQGMDTDGLERVTDDLERTGCLPKKSHQRSQSTGCVLVRKAPTIFSQTSATQDQGRRRWDCKLRQGVDVKSTWPGCEVKLGTCHCFAIPLPLVSHTRPP